jgi:hypothetical protein
LLVIERGGNFGEDITYGVNKTLIEEGSYMLNRDVHKNLSNTHNGANGWIETNSHETYFYGRRNPENINIFDIAHGLSNICRYAGQCNYFYSVAQHSCIIHDAAPNHLKAIGLFHDAAEAYTSDIPRPVKNLFPELRELEKRIQMDVADRFKLTFPWSSQIEILDSQLMLREAQLLFDGGVSWTVEGLDPLDVDIPSFWSPKRAKREFLLRYEEETNQRLLTGFFDMFHRIRYKRSIYLE